MTLPLAELVEQQDARLDTGTRRPSYVTGSHSMKFGYQGNYWRDDREMHVNSQSLGYIGISLPACRSSRSRSRSTSTRTT